MFIEERANIIDDIYSEWQGYFGLLKEAEYRVQLAPTLPEMTIHFRYAKEAEEDGYEFYLLWNPETEEFRFMRRDIFLARQAEKNTNPDKEETDAEPQEMPYTLSFIVEEGDSLWKISEECYGDGRQWQKIYEYNQDAIGENPSLILPGVELEMP